MSRAWAFSGFLSVALWFGGLFRLLGEGLAAVLGQFNESAPSALVPTTVATVVFVALVIVLLFRWSWYRSFLLQSVNDSRSLRGLRPIDSSEMAERMRRGLRRLALAILPSITIAALLPSVLFGALAMVIAVLLRIVLAVAGVTSSDAAGKPLTPRDIAKP